MSLCLSGCKLLGWRYGNWTNNNRATAWRCLPWRNLESMQNKLELTLWTYQITKPCNLTSGVQVLPIRRNKLNYNLSPSPKTFKDNQTYGSEHMINQREAKFTMVTHNQWLLNGWSLHPPPEGSRYSIKKPMASRISLVRQEKWVIFVAFWVAKFDVSPKTRLWPIIELQKTSSTLVISSRWVIFFSSWLMNVRFLTDNGALIHRCFWFNPRNCANWSLEKRPPDILTNLVISSQKGEKNAAPNSANQPDTPKMTNS